VERTPRQNSSLHLYFRQLAEELNLAGLDMRKVLKPTIAIPWSEASIKSFLWKPIQEAMFNKKSTTELTTAEVNKVFEVLDRHLLEKFDVNVAFPSQEELNYKKEIR